MKKILIVFSIILFACSNSIGQEYRFIEEEYAQNPSSDGFFASDYSVYRESNGEWGDMPHLPRLHGYELDHTARVPLGTGIWILGALGLGYAVRKRYSKKDEDTDI